MPKRRAGMMTRMKFRCGINVGTFLTCADNTGARKLQVIAVIGYKGVQRRIPRATVGDVVVCTVKDGKPELVGEIVRAVIIRQRAPYKRKDGSWICFEDNAAILIKPDGEPQGTEIRGPVAREAVMRFPSIGKLAKIVV